MENTLIVPDQFHTTAIAFPVTVKAMLASIDTPELAAEGLAKAQAIADFAKRIKATAEEVNHVQYGKLLLAAKVGELCPATPGERTDLTSHPAGERLPFHPNTLTDYRKLAKQQEQGRIDSYFTAVAEAGHDAEVSIAGFLRYIGSDGNIKAHQNRGVIEWYTPEKHIEAARKVMGSIDVDPASCEEANRIVQATRFYDKEDDGLEQPWFGNVWINPPFQASLIKQFIARLCEHVESGEVKQAILLTNNNTDTAWWHQAASLSACICFTKGRVAFYAPGGIEAEPTNGHTFFYFGKRVKQFQKQFCEFGFLMERSNGV